MSVTAAEAEAAYRWHEQRAQHASAWVVRLCHVGYAVVGSVVLCVAQEWQSRAAACACVLAVVMVMQRVALHRLRKHSLMMELCTKVAAAAGRERTRDA